MIILQPTINANSFCTIEEANLYIDSKLHNSEWVGAINEDKEKALRCAALNISNYFDFVGIKKEENQVLAFPRTSEHFNSDYPIFIKNACAEYALILLKSGAVSSSSEAIKSISFSGMKMDFKDTGSKVSIEDSFPQEVFIIIKKYIKRSHKLTRC